LRRIVLKAVMALACFLFMFSVFLPFLTVGWHGIDFGWPRISGETATFWSFKVTRGFQLRDPPFFSPSGETYNFVDYWYTVRFDFGGVWEGLMVLMFSTQVLTVLSAIVVICMRDRFGSYWLLLPGIYSAVTVLLMWFFSLTNASERFVNIIRFEGGFWLALTSAILFFVIFLASSLSMKTRRKPSVSMSTC
jgi:hypothetical protein